MTFQVIHSRDGGNARSPFRLIAQPMGREVEWVNLFLDREWMRRLAETTLRSYAMGLLHFLRWLLVGQRELYRCYQRECAQRNGSSGLRPIPSRP